MNTYTCRHCGGLLLSEKLDSCGCSAAATEELIARRSAAACSAVATIRRHKYPHEYSGWSVEHDSPKWTSDRLDAAPVPLENLVSELNKIAARETNIWAVVYPQNANVDAQIPASTKPESITD